MIPFPLEIIGLSEELIDFMFIKKGSIGVKINIHNALLFGISYHFKKLWVQHWLTPQTEF